MSAPDDDYLWDRRGDDAEVTRLEQVLAPYAYRPRPVRALAIRGTRGPWARWVRPGIALRWAAAAMLIATVLGAAALGWRLHWPHAAPWPVASVEGDVRVDGLPVTARAALAVGSEIVTGSDGSVQLAVARIGEARLGPGSRARLERSSSGEHRLRLLGGELHARVWAPPRRFGVQLPGADVLDLGCEFILATDADGAGELRVRSGWVLVAADGREALVPAGARVRLARDGVPGTPHDEAASAEFIALLHAADAAGPAWMRDAIAQQRLADAARRADAISLLSLLTRFPALAQGPLYDRLAALLPAGVAREAVLHDPTAALAPWWDALPYPRTKRWWLHWRDAWPLDAGADSPVKPGPVVEADTRASDTETPVAASP
jgi:hypothetical protein